MVSNDIIINDKYLPLFTPDGIKTRYVLVTGGRGSSKSFSVTLAAEMKLYEKNQKILFTRYTLDSAEDSIIPEFVEKLDLMDVRYDFVIRKKQITHKDSGSTILFRGIKTSSGRQTAKLKGTPGVTIFVVDEGEEMPEVDFDTIDRGIRSKNNQNIVIIIMNPSDTEHWVYRRFIKETHRFEVIDGYPVPISTHPDVTHIHTTYLDNIENLDADYVRAVILSLKEKDPEQYAAKIIGTWQDIRTGLEAYNHFNFGRHVRDFPFNMNLPVNASFDQNVVPYAYTSLWQFIFKQDHIVLYCYDEVVGKPPFHHTGETCKEIKRRHNRMAGFNYYGDASGNKRDTRTANTDYRIVEGHMRDYVNERSNRTWRVNPNVKKRLEFINLILAGLVPKVKIYVNPKCTVMISDLAKVKVDANGDKAKEMDKVDGVRFQKYGHGSDTFDYIIIKALEREFQNFIKSKHKYVKIYN